MSILEDPNTEVVETDVLVLGGGIAGCIAAIRAKEFGVDVVLVDRGSIGRSGLSPCMSGTLNYFDLETDDFDAWFREFVEAGEWVNDQECLESIFKESTELIGDLETWGAVFQKNDQGKFVRAAGAGMIHSRNIFMIYGGLQLMLAVRGEVLRRGVRVVERVMSTDLLASDGKELTNGKIVGAVGFNVRTGKFYVFKAKATIIATGGTLSGQMRCILPVNSGDGKGMGFRAGAQMRNVDLTSYGLRLRDFAGPIGPGLGIFDAVGAHFINAQGNRFMQKWDRQAMERARRVTVVKAIATEEREERGPVYVDATHLSDASHHRIEKAIPLVVNSLAAVGQSFRKDLIPYTIDLQDCGPGGIRTNREAKTSVPGLYAAGDASDHAVMGVTDIYGPGTLSAIGGRRAGKSAAKYVAEVEEPTINEQQVRVLKERIFAPMKLELGLRHYEVREHCRSILKKGLVGPFRHEKGLKEALDIVQEIKQEEITKVVATDYHELARSIGLRNELLSLEILANCCLLRTESRGGHCREDYPQRDDANWLKWVIAKRQDDAVQVWAEPIPFEEYRLKPKPGK